MPADISWVDWAARLGQQAVGAFLVALALATAAAGIGCLVLDRRRRARVDREADNGATGLARLVAGFGTGFALILLAASLFAAIADRLGPDRTMALADQALADAIGAHTPRAALVVFSGLTHLGDPPVLALLGLAAGTALWMRGRRLLAAGYLLALAGNALLNPLLKQLFERVRPVHDHGLAVATGFSFPSGHSSGAMVAYGMLLYLALRTLPARWHPAAAMAAVAVVLTTACSRVFLQVHFASDVAAGLLSGLAWLLVCVLSLEYAQHRQRRR